MAIPNPSKEDLDYSELMALRLKLLVGKGLISQQMADAFPRLEAAMNQGGLLGENFLASYQKSDDLYKRYLEKITRALKAIGEPHAEEKHRIVVEELATMGPAVFLTPWEITLSYLDRTYGDMDDVMRFYET
ncbi:MAG: hypothetical protein QNJ97_23430 [Myxococcota bacterium]|nr:hypothetical protein [Myxococcota bacterium]